MLQNLIFSDEKLFFIETAFIYQNDCAVKITSGYSSSPKQGKKNPNVSFSYAFLASVCFCILVSESGQINEEIYIKIFLEGGLVRCIQVQIGPFNNMEQPLI